MHRRAVRSPHRLPFCDRYGGPAWTRVDHELVDERARTREAAAERTYRAVPAGKRSVEIDDAWAAIAKPDANTEQAVARALFDLDDAASRVNDHVRTDLRRSHDDV